MKRFRELFPERAKELGFHAPGPRNAITDVKGVRVAHATVRDAKRGVHSGVTAIWPRADVYDFRPRASGHVLHGVGEVTGFHQLVEWGIVETPMLLTSTLNVGRVHDALVEYLLARHPEAGLTEDVLIPIVAECDDSFLNRARERPVGPKEVSAALDAALAAGEGAVVEEGGVGAGAGMVAFDYKGGIGTASRRVKAGPEGAVREYTVGALVNANLGFRRQLRAGGWALGRERQDDRLPEPRATRTGGERAAQAPSERSCIVVVATDAPMRADQLRRLSVRAGMGLARVGSFAGHASGELIVAFTTASGEPRHPTAAAGAQEYVHDAWLNSFYEATVEAVEESVLNAIAAGRTLEGRDGHKVYGLAD